MKRTYAVNEDGEVYYTGEDGRNWLADRRDADEVEDQLGLVYYDGNFLTPEEYEEVLEEKRDCHAPYHGMTYWECNPDFASW